MEEKIDLKQLDSMVSEASRIQRTPHPCLSDRFQLGPLLFPSRKKKENTQVGPGCVARTHDSGSLNPAEKGSVKDPGDWPRHHCQS